MATPRPCPAHMMVFFCANSRLPNVCTVQLAGGMMHVFQPNPSRIATANSDHSGKSGMLVTTQLTATPAMPSTMCSFGPNLSHSQPPTGERTVDESRHTLSTSADWATYP